jgi:hypothetical protein
MAAVEMLRAELPPIHGADLTAQMVQAVMVLSRILLDFITMLAPPTRVDSVVV